MTPVSGAGDCESKRTSAKIFSAKAWDCSVKSVCAQFKSCMASFSLSTSYWFAARGSLVFNVKMDYDDSSVLPSLESSAIFPSEHHLYQSLHCLRVIFCLRK